MSFLNTIRGLGRSSKKGKKDLEPTNSPPFYGNQEGPNSTLKRQSSTKYSPSKHASASPARGGGNGGGDNGSTRSIPTIRSSQQSNISPTKRSRNAPHQSSRSERKQSPQRTVQRVRSPPQQSETPLFLCEPYVRTALVKGAFKTIVQLPAFVDSNEWLALNIFEFFTNLDAFYGLIADFVTPESFPTMNAGPTTNYLWVDDSGQAINLPARQYIEYVITWISSKVNNQENFPTKTGAVFPPFFIKDVRNISRQMFRIFAFIYYNQFDKIVHLSLEAHFNSFFGHFISFIKEFNLLDKKEWEPLMPLIESFEMQGKID
ncbi:uncharacterized protein LODBEIA_P29190 [Lodderomyces beijingensis]|uniref:Maintenance of ploidy protein mob2 n=1 Tax=Lodderomyces beijingensis TaxID=1775926 RepID=A0ABP0ZKM7_9ASCO